MSQFSEGQIHQLANALENEGYTPEDVTRLIQGDLKGFRDVLRGKAKIRTINPLIDCDAPPFIPSRNFGWEIKEHKKGGKLIWNPEMVRLYLSDEQKLCENKGAYTVHDLYENLKNKPVLNANVLDFLLENPYLIPDEWKGRQIFFWGTTYSRSNGTPHVRYLYWDDGMRWQCSWVVINNEFHINDPAALRVS